MATPNIMKSNYNCGVCKEKAGFGRVRIPKAFELLVSILQAAGIDISLMTREKVKVTKTTKTDEGVEYENDEDAEGTEEQEEEEEEEEKEEEEEEAGFGSKRTEGGGILDE